MVNGIALITHLQVAYLCARPDGTVRFLKNPPFARDKPEEALGNVVLPHLNSQREEAEYDMLVLESKALYSYRIPSFYAISLKLRHIYGRAEDESGVNFYDVFFHEFPGCSNLARSHPSIVGITNGCIVEVCSTTLLSFTHLHALFPFSCSWRNFRKG